MVIDYRLRNHRPTRRQVVRRDNIRPSVFRKCDVEMIKNYESRYCCVPGCSSAEVKNPELHFYSFPGHNYEVARKKQWITAIRRQS